MPWPDTGICFCISFSVLQLFSIKIFRNINLVDLRMSRRGRAEEGRIFLFGKVLNAKYLNDSVGTKVNKSRSRNALVQESNALFLLDTLASIGNKVARFNVIIGVLALCLIKTNTLFD